MRRTTLSLVPTFKRLLLTLPDRKSTRLNSSHTDIYTLSLHDALPILGAGGLVDLAVDKHGEHAAHDVVVGADVQALVVDLARSEEHTSELQSHRYLHSFPTRRSSDLRCRGSRRSGCRQAR